MLSNLESGDVLFIDEIHRLSPVVEEILYPAMEDFQLDIMIGEGPAARSQAGAAALYLSRRHHSRGFADESLRDRFGIVQRLSSTALMNCQKSLPGRRTNWIFQ